MGQTKEAVLISELAVYLAHYSMRTQFLRFTKKNLSYPAVQNKKPTRKNVDSTHPIYYIYDNSLLIVILIVFVLSMTCDPKWILNLLLIGFYKPTVRFLERHNIYLVGTKPAGRLGGHNWPSSVPKVVR